MILTTVCKNCKKEFQNRAGDFCSMNCAVNSFETSMNDNKSRLS